MRDNLYNFSKWLVNVGLPGIAALYFILAPSLNLPNNLTVVGTLAIISFVLGVVLQLSSKMHRRKNDPFAGYLRVVGHDPDTRMPHLSMTFNKTPDELLEKETITIRVSEPPAMPDSNLLAST